MIRKIMVLVLLTLYSAVAIGVPLHYHYCGGELQHITLFTPKECASHDVAHHDVSNKVEEPRTCCMGEKISRCDDAATLPDCCNDQTELLQLDESVSPLVILHGNYADNIIVSEFTELVFIQYKEESPVDPFHEQPAKSVFIWLEHCSLVFYS